MTKRITVLYSELADYTIACLKGLVNKGVELQLIHWKINPEAPFRFDLSFCEHHSRETLSAPELRELVLNWTPDLILCSGWIDKGYLSVCRSTGKNIPSVLSMDNHWTGSWRQRFACLTAPVWLNNAFQYAFVPGHPQQLFAKKLGFSDSKVLTGFYSADVKRFQSFYEQSKMHDSNIPKRFLYLGRYVQHKGIFDLWKAYQIFREINPDWELWCVGTGDQYEKRIISDGIRHFGFIQPDQMLPILKETGVYILPSHFEPWGVSLHEMAVAGFPLLASDSIGAREAFVETDVNGRVFDSGSVDSIVDAMKWVASKSDMELSTMSQRSHVLGLGNTPEIWATKLLSFIS